MYQYRIGDFVVTYKAHPELLIKKGNTLFVMAIYSHNDKCIVAIV